MASPLLHGNADYDEGQLQISHFCFEGAFRLAGRIAVFFLHARNPISMFPLAYACNPYRGTGYLLCLPMIARDLRPTHLLPIPTRIRAGIASRAAYFEKITPGDIPDDLMRHCCKSVGIASGRWCFHLAPLLQTFESWV